MTVYKLLSRKLLAIFAAAALTAGLFVYVNSNSSANAAPVNAAAAVDYFLKIEGIDGESSDDEHKGEIEISSFSWGAQQSGGTSGGSGAGAGKVSLQDFHFVSNASKASPKLLLATVQGKHYPKAVLSARKAGEGQKDYLKISLSDVLISSYKTEGEAGGLPQDQFSLNFTKVEYQYWVQKPDGSYGNPIVTSYNVKTRTAQ